MLMWVGKREVMYTAFLALGNSVDYIQVRLPPFPKSGSLGIREQRADCPPATLTLMQVLVLQLSLLFPEQGIRVLKKPWH